MAPPLRVKREEAETVTISALVEVGTAATGVLTLVDMDAPAVVVPMNIPFEHPGGYVMGYPSSKRGRLQFRRRAVLVGEEREEAETVTISVSVAAGVLMLVEKGAPAVAIPTNGTFAHPFGYMGGTLRPT